MGGVNLPEGPRQVPAPPAGDEEWVSAADSMRRVRSEACRTSGMRTSSGRSR
jgi:hypothetical protein